MATIADITTIQSIVNSLLQTTRTPYGTTPDQSNAQYASPTEIVNAILYADFEIATLICNTMLHPYQSQFIASPTTVSGNQGVSPVRNGMIVRVTGVQGSALTYSFTSGSISTTTDLVTSANHGLVTGQAVQLTTSGSLPTGLSLATTYYIYAPTTSTYGFCTTIYNAKQGTLIDITNAGSGTNTVTSQYVELQQADRATVVQAINSPYLFAYEQGNVAGFWAEEGTEYYTTSPSSKIYYTDTTLTSVCQSPQPYTYGIASGAMTKLLKDGSDANEIGFYANQYQGYLQQVSSGAMAVPQIQAYTGGVQVT